MDNWAEHYEDVYGNPPTSGVIRTADGSPAKVNIELFDGRQPFVYAVAYVPDIVGQELGWFLVGINDPPGHGLRCIFLPRARKEIIERFGLTAGKAEIASINVINISKSGKSLLCEVHEYAR